uniref:Peptidase A2 domain-containing protein n=1 Tax=Haemonchus contortus TaxID=6289 RepID=A0A7I4Z6A6_HAECO
MAVKLNQPALSQHVLQIASALIFNEIELDYQTVTLLLDSGAQRSFIKSSLGTSLKLATLGTTSFTTVGMGELQESFESDEVRVMLKVVIAERSCGIYPFSRRKANNYYKDCRSVRGRQKIHKRKEDRGCTNEPPSDECITRHTHRTGSSPSNSRSYRCIG